MDIDNAAAAPDAENRRGLPGAEQRLQARYRAVRRITLIGAALDLVLGVAKLLGGKLAYSQALVADGVHSLSDLATDLMVLFAAKHSHVAADQDHPYGHGRIETVTTVGLGGVLVAVGLWIVYEAAVRLLHPESVLPPAAWALWFAAASVVSKELMYHYTMRYARRLRSNMLRANAWHTRSDAASSLVVIVGVGGAQYGLIYLDAVAAAVVAWMIGRIGVELGARGVQELIDTGLEPQELATIRTRILSVDGVADLHELKTRRMAGRVLVDVHIILRDPRVSVSEGHQISETVRARLLSHIEDIEDVMVHIDPEDDEHVPSGVDLELRGPILKRLTTRWSDIGPAARIKRVDLHYLNGRVHVEVELPRDAAADDDSSAALSTAFNEAVVGDPDIANIHLTYS